MMMMLMLVFWRHTVPTNTQGQVDMLSCNITPDVAIADWTTVS